MRKARRGFTIVEVALFLAVSGLLFVGIAVGVQNSVWQQRVNDSVQSFAEFLKTVYSQVSNPQSVKDGRSDQAIYGKLIAFGQTYGLDGNQIASDKQEVFVYDVIGDAESSDTGGTLEILKNLEPKVLVKNEEKVDFAGAAESYVPKWGAVIQDTNGKSFKGLILIVRNPRSGTVSTFIKRGSEDVLDINKIVSDKNIQAIENNSMFSNMDKEFSQQRVDFCINPDGDVEDGNAEKKKNRRDVRLAFGAHNASGVTIVGDDDNACNNE